MQRSYRHARIAYNRRRGLLNRLDHGPLALSMSRAWTPFPRAVYWLRWAVLHEGFQEPVR